MEESNGRGDLQANVLRQSSLRPSGSLKSTLSGRSTPRGSPSFRRSHSSRTPRREARGNVGSYPWIRGNRLVFWLMLITLWTYLGFYVQSRWAHSDNNNKAGFIGYQSKAGSGSSGADQNQSLVVKSAETGPQNASDGEDLVKASKKSPNLKSLSVSLVRKRGRKSGRKKTASKKNRKTPMVNNLHSAGIRAKPRETLENQSSELEEVIPRKNTSYGLIVGPFGKTEDSILEWSPAKRTGTCDRKGDFARLVWSRKFLLILHELSMTGAPLSMMELATKLLSCGATVSAVVLSQKGGLMGELSKRGIKVLPDKADFSFKTAMKSDLVIAGSAVCDSWIEQYLSRFPAGSNQIAWWIMENRREYFDRSKNMLNRVKMLIFLSDSQLKQWLAWCEEEHIQLNSQPGIVPLSVNDELAFVAGIPCSLNTPLFTVEKMIEKRRLLRDTVRKEMGVSDSDMLVVSLSSINPGKGQLLLLESALLTVQDMMKEGNMSGMTVDRSTVDGKHLSRALLEKVKSNGNYSIMETNIGENTMRHLSSTERHKQTLKVLIGSIGSKSNKVVYVKGILKFLSQHPELSKLVLWTPATTRVASLYAAADVYIINSQGLGETFGRVTIEAMAFGLPVLGTDAGGTREIIEPNVTGLLHPVGHQGTQILAQNLQFLLKDPSARQQMGMWGRSKVEKKFLKTHMYKKLAKILIMCMKIK